MYQPKADPDKSLVNNDPNSPLYFWQLYSILGPERITAVLTSFYTRVGQTRPTLYYLPKQHICACAVLAYLLYICPSPGSRVAMMMSFRRFSDALSRARRYMMIKEAPWFTNVFKIRSKEHHIRVNAQFWCDAMGGGKQFYGGDQRYGSSAGILLLNDVGAVTLRGFER